MTAPRLFLGSLALLFVSTIGRIITGSPATGYTLTAAEAVVLATCHDCANLDGDNPFLAAVALASEGQVPGGTLPAWTPERCLQYAPLFAKAEADHDVPAALLVSVAIAESGCQPAPSGPASGMNDGYPSSAFDRRTQYSQWADALAQETGMTCRPNTSTAFGLMQITTAYHYVPGRDWCDPVEAVDYGASFLARLGATAGAGRDAIRRAIYAYNSGGNRTAEGDRYLRWVGGMWDERDAASSPTFLDWCRAGSGFDLEECHAGAERQ